MLNNEYPTEVAKILNITKEEYEKIANNKEALEQLKKELEVAENGSKHKQEKEMNSQMQLMRLVKQFKK